jgi:hypothetical protein
MAQNSSVYDDQDTDTKELEEMFHAPSATTSGSDKLKEQEAGTDQGNQAAGNGTSGNDVPANKYANGTNANSLQSAEKDAGGYYSPGEKPKNNKKPKGPSTNKNGWWNKKRAGIAGGTTGIVLMVAGMLGLTTLSPVAQFIQLDQTLQIPQGKANTDSANRLGRWYKYLPESAKEALKSTKAGRLADKVLTPTIDQLANKGVTTERGRTGAPTRTNFDMDKLSAHDASFKGLSGDEAKSALAEALKLPANKISGSGTKLYVDQGDFSLSESRLLVKNTVYLTGPTPKGVVGRTGAGLINSMKIRSLTKTFNLPSLLHPLKRTTAAIENKLLNGKATTTGNEEEKAKAAEAAEAAAEAVEEKSFASTTEAPNAASTTATEEVKDESAKYNSVAMKALLFTGGACYLRSIAGDVVTINHYRVAVPAALMAVQLIAIGEQVKYGGADTTATQLGVLSKKIFGNDGTGHNIWTGQALEQLGTGKHHTGDPDITADFQQAFSDRTTAGQIKAWASKSLGGETAANAACSKAGLFAQALVGLGAGAASIIGEVGSGGTLTPAIVGGWALKESINFAVSAVAMHFIQEFILNKTTAAKLTEAAFKGPVGGSLLAYGAREAANMTATNTGGISLNNHDSTLSEANERKAVQQQFAAEPFFSRMFDAYDSRSLFGQLMQHISPSFSQNMFNFASSLMNVNHSFAGVLTGMLPKVSAEETTYDWTFAQTGIPSDMLNDPSLANPIANSNHAADLLNATCLNGDSADTSCDFISRIDACFGNTVSYDTTDKMWDTTVGHDVDKHSDAYEKANCDGIGGGTNVGPGTPEGQWRSMVMWVNDTNDMKAAACFEGKNNDACDDLGSTYPDSSDDAAAAAFTGGSTTTGMAAYL